MKTQINATIVADSLNPQGDRLISLLITFPRIILAEVNTHRMLSKNTSSSRAIPFKKMVEAVENDPFIPIAWQKHHSGMQGTEYLTDKEDIKNEILHHLSDRDEAIKRASARYERGVTKQICNRYLEPFMWTTMLITGSKEGWDNFFSLRCPQYPMSFINDFGGEEVIYYKSKKEWLEHCGYPKSTFKVIEDNHINVLEMTDFNWLQINEGQAEIHIMDLAEKIYDALNESTPKKLKSGEWHIPFEDKLDTELSKWEFLPNIHELWGKDMSLYLVKVSTAMAARTSYTVVGDEKEINYQKMIELHDRLISQNPPHSSPMEHCAKAMTHDEYYSFQKGFINMDELEVIVEDSPTNGWCRNFKGFIQYRHLIETNEAI